MEVKLLTVDLRLEAQYGDPGLPELVPQMIRTPAEGTAGSGRDRLSR